MAKAARRPTKSAQRLLLLLLGGLALLRLWAIRLA